jgi:hypothetical protein
MVIKSANKLKLGLANFFGGLGYIFLILEWLVLVLTYFYWVQSWGIVKDMRKDTPPPAPISDPVSINDGSLLYVILGAIITVFMIVLALYAFIKLPSMIVKTSRRVVHKTAEFTAPAALHIQHKKATKKNRIKITPKLVIILKAIFILIAAGLIFGAQFLSVQELEFSLVVMMGVWLLGMSAAAFVIQYIVVRVFRIDMQRIW